MREIMERETLRPERGDEPAVDHLPVDDLVQVQRSADHEDRDDRETHRELVGDHLGRGADASDEGELRVGGPSGQRDAVDAEGGNRENVEDADVQVGDRHLDAEEGASEGKDRQHEDRRDHHELRSEPEVELVHPGRDKVLLGQELDRVGDHLAETEEKRILLSADQRPGDADAVRAGTILDEGADLTLRKDRHRDDDDGEIEEDEGLQERRPKEEHPGDVQKVKDQVEVHESQ